MEYDFFKNSIKDYQYWTVYAHPNQGYLGRCIVWCKRENALELIDATPEEQAELFLVLNKLKAAAQKCFNPDWLNYAFLGNEVAHLHGHFIPRYAKPKTFEGITFEDALYGHNYKTDKSFVTTEALLNKVVTLLTEELK